MSAGQATTEQQRAAFAAAVTRAMQDAAMRAPAVAAKLGVSEDTVRKYANGTMTPGNPTAVFALEAALGRQPGDLSRHLGYRPTDARVSTLDAIDSDPALHETARAMLRAAYEQAVRNGAGRPD